MHKYTGKVGPPRTRVVSQRWGQLCISVVERIFHKSNYIKLLAELFKCYLPVIMDRSVYFFPSITKREVGISICNCGSVCVPCRAVSFPLSDWSSVSRWIYTQEYHLFPKNWPLRCSERPSGRGNTRTTVSVDRDTAPAFLQSVSTRCISPPIYFQPTWVSIFRIHLFWAVHNCLSRIF